MFLTAPIDKQVMYSKLIWDWSNSEPFIVMQYNEKSIKIC